MHLRLTKTSQTEGEFEAQPDWDANDDHDHDPAIKNCDNNDDGVNYGVHHDVHLKTMHYTLQPWN